MYSLLEHLERILGEGMVLHLFNGHASSLFRYEVDDFLVIVFREYPFSLPVKDIFHLVLHLLFGSPGELT